MDEIDEEALELSGLDLGALSSTEVCAEPAYAETAAAKTQQFAKEVDTRETLEPLKQSALQRRAKELGATDAEIETAIDDETNPKGALIELVLSRSHQVAALDSEAATAEATLEDVYQLATEEAAFDTVDEAEEQAYYTLADSVNADEEEEEEEEEEEGEGDPVVEEAEIVSGAVVGDEKSQSAPALEEEDDDDDGVMFFEDVGNPTAASPSPDEPVPPHLLAKKCALPTDGADDIGTDEPTIVAVCAQCGLPGHATTQCPFGHPEDIELGDMDESDSDNELSEKHPMLARYISQHTAALHPKHKKGLTGEKRYFGEDKTTRCWVCGGADHDSNDCSLKCCFFCGQQGHDGRDCPERSSICTHCRCKGHIPVSCPTLASKAIVPFTSAHCMRCGELGHVNCGIPPLAPQLKAAPPFQRPGVPFPGPPAANGGPILFNLGLPPPTPASPPPSPLGQMGPPPDSFRLVRPRPPNGSVLSPLATLPGAVPSKSSSLAAAPSRSRSPPRDSEPTFSKAAQNAPVPSGKSSQIAGANGALASEKIAEVPGKAPIAKVPGKAPIAKVPGKAAIAKVPGIAAVAAVPGKAPIAKVPGKAPIAKVSGKASIAKVPGKSQIGKTPAKAPITKVPAKAKSEEKGSLMKASAKKPSKSSGPPAKKQRTW